MGYEGVRIREFDDDPCCMVWPAARVLCSWLRSELRKYCGRDLEGAKVLELGAGTGFLALRVASLGAVSVMAVEGAEQGCGNLEHNIAQSGCCNVACLNWNWEEKVGTIPNEIPADIDFILASDIVYPRHYDVKSLCTTVFALLERSVPTGKPPVVLFSLCDRTLYSDNGLATSSLDAFYLACDDAPLKVSEVLIGDNILIEAGVANKDGGHDDPGGAEGTQSQIRLFRLEAA